MDDLRALVSEQQRAEGAGNPLADIDDPNAVQRTGHTSPPGIMDHWYHGS
jgi:hypothetical protein